MWKKLTTVLAVAAMMSMTLGLPALAAEYDAGYKDCPSNEIMVVKTKTTHYSTAEVDATSGSDYGPVTYSWGTSTWKYRHHYTSAVDGTWEAVGQQLSQFWTSAYCD